MLVTLALARVCVRKKHTREPAKHMPRGPASRQNDAPDGVASHSRPIRNWGTISGNTPSHFLPPTYPPPPARNVQRVPRWSTSRDGKIAFIHIYRYIPVAVDSLRDYVNHITCTRARTLSMRRRIYLTMAVRYSHTLLLNHPPPPLFKFSRTRSLNVRRENIVCHLHETRAFALTRSLARSYLDDWFRVSQAQRQRV